MCPETAAGIQAWAALLGLPLSAATLAYLVRYTQETVRLRELGQAQFESAQRPVVIGYEQNREIHIKNIGSGPALNASWTKYTGVAAEVQVQEVAIEINQAFSLGMMSDIMFSQLFKTDKYKVVVEYASQAGQRYRSTICWSTNSGQLLPELKLEKI